MGATETIDTVTTAINLDQELQEVGVYEATDKVIIGLGIVRQRSYQQEDSVRIHLSYRIPGAGTVFYGRQVAELSIEDRKGRRDIAEPGRAREILAAEVIGPLAKLLNTRRVRDWEIVVEPPLVLEDFFLGLNGLNGVPRTVAERVNGGRINYLDPSAKPQQRPSGKYFFKL